MKLVIRKIISEHLPALLSANTVNLGDAVEALTNELSVKLAALRVAESAEVAEPEGLQSDLLHSAMEALALGQTISGAQNRFVESLQQRLARREKPLVPVSAPAAAAPVNQPKPSN